MLCVGNIYNERAIISFPDTSRSLGTRALTRTGPIMPVSLPFILVSCPLLETTDYAGNYARIIAASLVTTCLQEATELTLERRPLAIMLGSKWPAGVVSSC